MLTKEIVLRFMSIVKLSNKITIIRFSSLTKLILYLR